MRNEHEEFPLEFDERRYRSRGVIIFVGDLFWHFANEVATYRPGETIGMEVETQFCSKGGKPISARTSQRILEELSRTGWKVAAYKGNLIAELRLGSHKILYELSRANLELAVGPMSRQALVPTARQLLEQMYLAASRCGADPVFEPLLLVGRPEDLLIVPDRRDASFVKMDGREVLALLTQCSAVHFSIDVTPELATKWLNVLGANISSFLKDYPQDRLWRDYISRSAAGYEHSRYGGPLLFQNLFEYSRRLAAYEIIVGEPEPHLERYLPGRYRRGKKLDIPRFLRSVWWYFRLRRYGPRLCIEVRPLPRRSDECLGQQLESVLDLLSL